MEVPADERAIEKKLLKIRKDLETLKADRCNYVTSERVLPLYKQLVNEIQKVNAMREQPAHKGEQNRLDVLFDDCFALMSLFFLSLGKNNEAPATFASIVTIKRLLDHLTESRNFGEKDLRSIEERLQEMRSILESSKGRHEEAIIHFLTNALDSCDKLFQNLKDSLKDLSPELTSTLDKLISIRRQMAAIGSKPKFSSTELKPLIDELRQIEGSRVDGQFLSATGDIPAGQSILIDTITQCHTLAQELAAEGREIPESLQPLYHTLLDIRCQLERLNVTRRWTLRETDLHSYQHQLQEIDDKRVNGKFVDENGNAPEGQWVLLYLLRKSYAMIYGLLLASEAVAESLMPVHNQLSTVKRCLLAVKQNGGLSSARELYPYQMKLSSIEALRKDGKFWVGETIPEGQGLLNALLSECFELCHELRSEMDENDDD